jgi:hypothetical protein
MPFTIDTSQPTLRVTFTGTLSNQDLLDAGKEAARIESGYSVIPHRLCDLRPVTRVEINFQGVLALATERLKLTFPNSFKSAIIANDVVRYGFARMFETLNDHPQITIAIFSDEPEAMRWLSEAGAAPSRQSAGSRSNLS